MKLNNVKIGFVGTGQMANALASGFVRDLVSANRIFGCDPVLASRETFVKAVGDAATVSAKPRNCLEVVDIVFLAVKPQYVRAALAELSEVLNPDQLVVSIAAGITISTLEENLPAGQRVMRVMPNTPCLIGKGACGVSSGTHATETDSDTVCQLLDTIGLVERLHESLLDAVTGLSGSGPAYVFQMIEALSDGGVLVGLPRATATRLAAQTLAGAAEMLLQTGKHPGVLKDAVTSPGGTTIAGLQALEQAGLRAALIDAVQAATIRSKELGSN